MAILLTGLGYIGAQLATDLLARGERVVAVENFFCTRRRDLAGLLRQPGIELVTGSINSAATWRKVAQRGPFSALVHLAAQPSAHPAAASTSYTELTNLVGARLALEAALNAGVERVVLGSSFKVYGDNLPVRVSEDQPYGTVGDLAHLSKIYTEKLAEMLGRTRSLHCVAVRLGITYGLGPILKTDPRFMTVPNLFCKLAATDQPLTVHPGAIAPAGFIHVVDASRALQAGLALRMSTPYVAVNAVTECLTVGEVSSLVGLAAQTRGLTTMVTGSGSAASARPSINTSLEELADSPLRMASSLGAVLDFFLARR